MTEAGWNPDPTGRHRLRYHDGTDWTDSVSDAGDTGTDPFTDADRVALTGATAAMPAVGEPETAVPPSPATPPPYQGAPPPVATPPPFTPTPSPTDGEGGGSKKGLVIGAVVAVLALLGIGGFFLLSGDDGDDDVETSADGGVFSTAVPPDETEAPATTDAPDTTEAPATTDAPDTTEAPATTDAPDTTEAPSGPVGAPGNPVPIGQAVSFDEDSWQVAVQEVVPDATDVILDFADFNDPPAAGTQYLMVTFVANYTGTEEPAFLGGDLLIDLVDANGRAAESFSCGLIPDELPQYADVFSTAVVTGNLCWAVTPEFIDGGHIEISDFFTDPVHFSLSARADSPVEFPRPEGPAPDGEATEARTNPNARGTAVEIGSWSFTVTGTNPAGTDAVLAENQFNDPPPDGSTFWLVEATVTNNSGAAASPFSELTYGAVGVGNVAYDQFSCGVIPDELDLFSDVAPGASVSGNLCFVAPTAEADQPAVLYVYEGFDGTKYTFDIAAG